MSISDLVGMLTLMKGLPLAYNRDMQDDKHFVINSVETMIQSLVVAEGIVSTAVIQEPDLREGFLDATSLAEYLTAGGIPFRQAHAIVGQIVAAADKKGIALSELTQAELKKHCKNIGPDVNKYLGAENVVKRYWPDGACGRKQLSKQLSFWKRKLVM